MQFCSRRHRDSIKLHDLQLNPVGLCRSGRFMEAVNLRLLLDAQVSPAKVCADRLSR